MPKNLDTTPSTYAYPLPEEAIAKTPANPRDSAKLLVYNRAEETVTFTSVRDLPKFLPPQSLLVFNETKVIPARLTLTTASGKHVTVLYVGKTPDTIRVLAPGKFSPGAILSAKQKPLFEVAKRVEKILELRPLFPIETLPNVLDELGTTPLPPYLDNSPLSEKQRRAAYQTMFARRPGSVAAPTASLHFTPELLKYLEKAGIETTTITLHVNLGTFLPVTEDQIERRALHEEQYEVTPAAAEKIRAAQQADRPIIAVGTTVARTLESAADSSGHLKPGKSSTTLFISPGYSFKVLTGLMTNFHVPESSLMMLVASLTGREKLLELYQQALNHNFRFLSFGDGMLIV